ncbi:MAG: N-acetyl-gamma-glutamyl-phosphate reductase [Rhodothermales bacterium]
MSTPIKQVALLHGAGYVGGEVIKLLTGHPLVELVAATSRAFTHQPVWSAHSHLRGTTDLTFCSFDDLDLDALDAILVTAEHGQGVAAVQKLLDGGFEGAIIDLTADFRFTRADQYEQWFGYTHPAPELLDAFVYGLVEVNAPYPEGTMYVANPGCFATATSLALYPLGQHLGTFDAHIQALTGASGSGAKPKPTTHFPTRSGNVRAYKVLQHQHLPEMQQVAGEGATLHFVPVSGPWTRGIWGTMQVSLPDGITEADVSRWYHAAYIDKPLIRLWDGLPELRTVVNTPFADLGWVVQDGHLVVGFAIDNLMKGAASQAVQNLNLVLGLPETVGLLPSQL